jgi:hypothetical protein
MDGSIYGASGSDFLLVVLAPLLISGAGTAGGFKA